MPVSSEPLDRLDAGEHAAILLAEAQRQRIPVTGTLGVLCAAALRHLVDLPGALARLRTTNFRCPASLPEELIADDRERKRSKRGK